MFYIVGKKCCQKFRLSFSFDKKLDLHGLHLNYLSMSLFSDVTQFYFFLVSRMKSEIAFEDHLIPYIFLWFFFLNLSFLMQIVRTLCLFLTPSERKCSRLCRNESSFKYESGLFVQGLLKVSTLSKILFCV